MEVDKCFSDDHPDVYGLSQIKKSVTLSEDQYMTLANYAASEVKRLCSNLSLWNAYSSKNGIEVFERKSDIPDTDSMLLLIVSLPCSTHKLETLLSPSFEYRLQWDTMLDGIQVLREWPEEEIFLIRHMVHKLYTISARDSIDIVKIMRGKDELLFGATGAMHADHPPCKKYVRTHQYLGGYFIRPCDSKPNHLKFHMLFHADLNMAGPRFISTVASKFKPKVMVGIAENLLKAIDKFEIN